MGEGFIVRRGGVVTEQTLAPTITKVSNTDTSITFTLKNNDTATATLVYRFSSLTGDGESISLAADTTSSNIELTGLTLPGTLFVTANATGKVKSSVVETQYELIYTAATGGTTAEYNDGGKRYKSHTFTSSGTFTVTTVGDAIDDRNKVDYLIIAGGAGGGDGGGAGGGGGGAGGFRTTVGTQGGLGTLDSKKTVTAQAYTITVGLGGDRGGTNSIGTSGQNTSALGETATGGGGGGFFDTIPASGGSGGGAGGQNVGTISGAAGTANQGFAGGSATSTANDPFPGAGGGGAGQVGQNKVNTTTAGNGGNGLANTLRDGTSETRAGGGGGAIGTGSGTIGQGGSGGGGQGANRGTANGTNGTVNTGSGGGGGSNPDWIGGNGGSGLVVIRYEIAPSV